MDDSSQARPLRCAILCGSESLERWQARCIDHLLRAEGVEVAAILVAEGAARAAPPRRGFSRLSVRGLPRDAVALAGLADGVPRVRVDLREPAAVRALEPDVVLALGVDRPSRPVADVARLGVWAFDFDLDWSERAGLGALWRVLRGEAVTDVALLRLTSAGNRAVVLRQGWFRTDDRAPLAGFARARDEAARWPAWACAALRRDKSGRLEGPVVDVSSSVPVPGAAQAVQLATILLRNRLRLAWGRLFRHPQWNIGIVDEPIHALVRPEGDPHVRWFPLAGRSGFLADPFGAQQGANDTIICEYFDYRRAKGTVCSIDVSDGEFASAPQPALELAEHMSYPFLVEEDGELYCIPETHRAREVTLFKADPFPRRWTKVATLLSDVSAMDSTVFRHGGRWWLTCADGDTGGESNLLVWHAPRLEGPWTAHAANPVKIDVRSARPGGTPFEHEGRLYRPTQDCSRAYGGRIVVNEVTRLTPTEFAEEPVATIAPAADGPYPAGRHTLSTLGDRTLIDGHRFVFVGAALGHFLRIWARDLVGAATHRRPRRAGHPEASIATEEIAG